MRRAVLALTALALLTLTACGGGETPDEDATAAQTSPSSTQPASPSDSGSAPAGAATDDGDTGGETGEDTGDDTGTGSEVIEITISGDRITPNGERVQVAAGEPIRLAVTSDRAAELHVHSSPERTIEVRPGTSRHRLTIERPGLVDVEEHESGLVVVQLEVR